MLKKMTVAVILAACVWAGYWFWSASQLRTQSQNWFETRQDDGWIANYDDLSIRGFPNRLDRTFTNVELADPDHGLAWTAPFFQILRLTYQPNHLIAVWPETQTFATPNATWTIQSDGMRASAVQNSDGILERANLESNVLNIANDQGGFAFALLNAALLRNEGANPEYRLAVSADGYAPGFIPPQGFSLPETFETLRADMTVQFSDDLRLDGMMIERPQPTTIDLRLAEAKWGQMTVKLAGKATLDNAGFATGTVSIKAENWRDMLEVMRANTKVPSALLDVIDNSLALVAGLSGNARSLDLTLSLDQGVASLGIIPVGRIPPIKFR